MARKPETSRIAPSIVRVLVVVLIGFLTAGTAIIDLGVLWTPQGDDGITLNKIGIVRSVAVGSPAAAVGIKAGDRIAGGDSEFFRPLLPGRREELHVSRGSATRTIVLHTAAAKPLTFEERGSLLVNACVFLVSLAVGSVLVLMRPSRMTWAFYIFGASTVWIELGIAAVDSQAVYWALKFSLQYLHALGDGAMLVFAARFPNDAPIGWRKSMQRAGLAVCLLFPPLQIYTWPFQEIRGHLTPSFLYIVNDFVYAAVYLAAMVTFVAVYLQSEGQERQRIQWALIFPIALTIRMPLILNRMLPSPFDIPTWFGYVGELSSVLIPLGVAYAIVRHRVFDITFAISRTIVYAALTSIIVAAFSLLHWFLAEELAQSRLALAASIVVALSLGFWFNALHSNLDRLVDRTLFQKRHDAERRLSRATAALAHADSHDAVTHFLIHEPVAALDLASAAVFRLDNDGRFTRAAVAYGWTSSEVPYLTSSDPLVVHLLATLAPIRVMDIAWYGVDVPRGAAAPALAVPVVVGRRLVEILVYGGHHNGADIDPDEARDLAPLAIGAASAYDRLEAEALRAKVNTLLQEFAVNARQLTDTVAENKRLRAALGARRGV